MSKAQPEVAEKTQQRQVQLLQERLAIETEHLKMQEQFMKEQADDFHDDYARDLEQLERLKKEYAQMTGPKSPTK